MPIKQQNGDWYWGSKGPFDTKAKAEQVQQAAYASGYKGAIQKFAVFQKEKRYEKNEVEYAPATEGQVKRGQQCSTCYFFQLEEQACLIVEGKIGEDMWCNKWEEQDKIMKEDELSDVDRLVFLMEEIAIIESRFQPEDTGHLRTTVGVLKERVKEVKEKIKEYYG